MTTKIKKKDRAAFDRVRTLMRGSIMNPPIQGARLFRVTSGRHGDRTMFLLQDEETGVLTLLEGRPISAIGYLEGLNTLALSGPLAPMLRELGAIDQEDCLAFTTVAAGLRYQSEREANLDRLITAAASLGYKLVKAQP